jgi:hypothetical protein
VLVKQQLAAASLIDPIQLGQNWVNQDSLNWPSDFRGEQNAMGVAVDMGENRDKIRWQPVSSLTI